MLGLSTDCEIQLAAGEPEDSTGRPQLQGGITPTNRCAQSSTCSQAPGSNIERPARGANSTAAAAATAAAKARAGIPPRSTTHYPKDKECKN
jgi:hypothetical protein